MIRKVLILVVFSLSFNSQAQEKLINQAVLDSIISYSKTNSVLRDSVDWQVLEQKMKDIHEADGLVESTKYMLKELNDFHGRIWVDDIPYNGVYKPWVPGHIKLDSADFRAYQYTSIPAKAELLNDKIAYLRVPGIVMSEKDAERAAQLSSMIDSLSMDHDLEGWVIDLRLNGGGTMYPMLAGLASFFEPGPLGYFIDETTGYKEAWNMREGELYFEDYPVTDYKMKPKWDYNYTPVVVLISALTASSGEVVTLAFRNRPNTLILGEATSGYTTTVGWQPMAENVILQLTLSYYADRKENIFKGTPIEPDEECIKSCDFDNLLKDEEVLRAMEWLESKR